jgi:type VI secretion system protein ImpE
VDDGGIEMTLSDAAAQTLKEGDPRAALARLQEDIRAKPSDAKLRVFLFQLLCILGQWDRALNQLKVASELDPLALPMAQMYGEAVRCELIRSEVFDGKKSPMVLGEPEQWLAVLIEARLRAGRSRSIRGVAAARVRGGADVGWSHRRPPVRMGRRRRLTAGSCA